MQIKEIYWSAEDNETNPIESFYAFLKDLFSRVRPEYFSVCSTFADLHIKQHSKVPDYLEQIKIVESYIDLMGFTVNESSDGICSFNCLFLGDFYDEPRPNSEEFESGFGLVQSILRTIKQSNKQIVGSYIDLSGNHTRDDYSNKDFCEVTYNIIKEGIDHSNRVKPEYNFKYASKPSIFYSTDGKICFHTIPYHPDIVANPSLFKTEHIDNNIDEDVPNICLFHMPIANAMFDNGMISSSGALLPQDFFDGFDFAIGGDYHTPQQLDSFNNKNVFYLGAPFQFNFGHSFTPRLTTIVIDRKNSITYFYYINTEDMVRHINKTNVKNYTENNLTKDEFRLFPYSKFVSIDVNDFVEKDRKIKEITSLCSEELNIKVNLRLNGYKTDEVIEWLTKFYSMNSVQKLIESKHLQIFDSVKPIKAIQAISGNVHGNDDIRGTISNLRQTRGQGLFEDLGRFVLNRIEDESLLADVRSLFKKNTIETISGGE